MASRARDWFDQAVRDLAHARHAVDDADFEWACFAAQQACEKAVKALYQQRGEEAWGHAVSALLEGLEPQIAVPPELLDLARELDQHYIPSRYPNAHPEGAPYRFYTRGAATRAVSSAETILAWCENILPR